MDGVRSGSSANTEPFLFFIIYHFFPYVIGETGPNRGVRKFFIVTELLGLQYNTIVLFAGTFSRDQCNQQGLPRTTLAVVQSL